MCPCVHVCEEDGHEKREKKEKRKRKEEKRKQKLTHTNKQTDI